MPGLVFLLFIVPGLLLLIFVVVQFFFRGKTEMNAAMWQREGRCRNCGYDLRGNASGCCPECGTAIPQDETEEETCAFGTTAKR